MTDPNVYDPSEDDGEVIDMPQQPPTAPQQQKPTLADRTINNMAQANAQLTAENAVLKARLQEMEEYLTENAEKLGLSVQNAQGDVIRGGTPEVVTPPANRAARRADPKKRK